MGAVDLDIAQNILRCIGLARTFEPLDGLLED